MLGLTKQAVTAIVSSCVGGETEVCLLWSCAVVSIECILRRQPAVVTAAVPAESWTLRRTLICC